MSSSRDRTRMRILLDTTYLLPVVGVEVEDVNPVLRILARLYHQGAVEIYYTPFNLLEITGKLSRTGYDRERVRLGLASIRESFRITHPTPAGYLKALELRVKGFKDLVDLLLYTTSRTRRLSFLTRDTALVRFLEKVGESTDNILLEDTFIRKHGTRPP